MKTKATKKKKNFLSKQQLQYLDVMYFHLVNDIANGVLHTLYEMNYRNKLQIKQILRVVVYEMARSRHSFDYDVRMLLGDPDCHPYWSTSARDRWTYNKYRQQIGEDKYSLQWTWDNYMSLIDLIFPVSISKFDKFVEKIRYNSIEYYYRLKYRFFTKILRREYCDSREYTVKEIEKIRKSISIYDLLKNRNCGNKIIKETDDESKKLNELFKIAQSAIADIDSFFQGKYIPGIKVEDD